MTCCDLIVSGHCLLFSMIFQVVWRYFSSNRYLLHWYFSATCIGSMILVVVTRMHYTIDAVVAVLVNQVLWQNYHLLLNYTQIDLHRDDFQRKSPSSFFSSKLSTFFKWWDSDIVNPVAVPHVITLVGMLICSFMVLGGPSIRIWTE